MRASTPKYAFSLDSEGRIVHHHVSLRSFLGISDDVELRSFFLNCLGVTSGSSSTVVFYEETGVPMTVEVFSVPSSNEGIRWFCLGQLGPVAGLEVQSPFQELLETAPDAMVVVDPSGRIVLVNSQTERLFGYSRAELMGQTVDALVPLRFRNAHPGHRERFFSTPRTREMGAGLQLYGLRKSGEEFPVEISLSPLETSSGTLVTSAIRDVSDRRRIERDLYDKNLELEAAAQAKNRFFASMSHELRTPLNGIIGFAEFMLDGRPGPLNDRQHEYLTDVLNSGKHLLQLINDVLDLAKVEAGRMRLYPERIVMEKLIHEVCNVARPVANKKRLRLEIEVASDVSEVFLDPKKTKQILYNLISNAVKFTDEGGIVVVSVRTIEEERIEVSVRDTGIGIQTENLSRLFSEFEQLEHEAGRRQEGTGLGLALTRKMVELQGGSVGVESTPGKGSRFWVTLPRDVSKLSQVEVVM